MAGNLKLEWPKSYEQSIWINRKRHTRLSANCGYVESLHREYTNGQPWTEINTRQMYKIQCTFWGF